MGGEGGLWCGPSPTCLGLGAGLLPVGGHGLPGGAPAACWGVCVCVCVVCVLRWIRPASGMAELSLEGRGAGGETVRGRGPLLGPWWVGERPPGSDCEARPSVTATINMFVQGKPGWELGALAWGGRKGRLCLAHWGDCSCSRNCCPVAGKVRRPSGPVGSNRCLGPLVLAPSCSGHSPQALRALARGGKVLGWV